MGTGEAQGVMATLGELAEQSLRVVREAKVLAYDTETSGVDWKRNSPIGYVITTRDFNTYIPVRHGGGGNLNDPAVAPITAADAPFVRHDYERRLSQAFSSRRQQGLLTIGHNLIFDMHFSANAGIMLGRECGDTQLNAAMLDEYARSYSLENCAKREGVTAKLGTELYEHIGRSFDVPAERKSMEHFWRLPGNDPLAVDYAMGDGTSTLELWDAQMKGIEAEDMGMIHGIESRLIWTVFRMERRGIKVDQTRLQEVKYAIHEYLKEAELQLPPDFNVRSGPQMKALMEQMGHTDWPVTRLGNPSFPEKWLKGHETGRAVVNLRKYSNLLNSFVTPLEERHMFNGRVHCQLNQLKADDYGTISGRFSCSNPNLQQVPKRDKELGRLFRSIYVPDDDMEFYEGDYSQCEPRLFAHYSQDPRLLEGYNAVPFRDVHQIVAEDFGCERDPTAKRMNMGIFTGMQIESFADHMGWPMDRAAEAFNRWFEKFSSIRDFQDRARDALRDRGWVRTILGRRQRMDHPRFAYRGTSKIIQGSNADIIKRQMLLIDEALESEWDDRAQLLITVHDSFGWQAPEGPLGAKISEEIVKIAEDVQGAPYNLRVPFVMEVGHGPNWAIATYGEPK